MSPRVSVVVATYNRGPKLAELFADLEAQTLTDDEFELIVVDDGSDLPAEDAVGHMAMRFAVTLVRQDNTGQAGARQNGAERAAGEIIVIVDDDMRLPPNFLAAHLGHHDAGADVVLGHIRPPDHVGRLPLFERFHLWQLDDWVQSFEDGRRTVRGVHLCTGNVSFSRKAFFEVGGFDTSLRRSEDRDLGLRFEMAGKKLVFAKDAISWHHTDHEDTDVWLRRAFLYGVHDSRIAEKHPGREIASPWRLFYLAHPASRPFIAMSALSPRAGKALRRAGLFASQVLDKAGLEGVAIKGCTVSYNLEYFRGVAEHAGSKRQLAKDLVQYHLARRASA